MKKIHNFLERFLGFILTCHILKGNARFLLHICLGFALAYAHAHDPAAFVHAAHGEHQKSEQKQCRQNHAQDHCNKFTKNIRRIGLKLDSLSFQSLGKCCTIFGLRGVIAHILVLGILFLGYDRQCTGLDRYFFNLVLIHHIDKFIIGYLTAVILQHISKQREAHQCDQEAYQKSQDRLMIFT